MRNQYYFINRYSALSTIDIGYCHSLARVPAFTSSRQFLFGESTVPCTVCCTAFSAKLGQFAKPLQSLENNECAPQCLYMHSAYGKNCTIWTEWNDFLILIYNNIAGYRCLHGCRCWWWPWWPWWWWLLLLTNHLVANGVCCWSLSFVDHDAWHSGNHGVLILGNYVVLPLDYKQIISWDGIIVEYVYRSIDLSIRIHSSIYRPINVRTLT